MLLILLFADSPQNFTEAKELAGGVLLVKKTLVCANIDNTIGNKNFDLSYYELKTSFLVVEVAFNKRKIAAIICRTIAI